MKKDLGETVELSLTGMQLLHAPPQVMLARLNQISEKQGLTLSQEEYKALALGREQALQSTGRMEFSEGILPKLVYAFCDSPFLSQESYQETLSEMQSLFYQYKNDTSDDLSDDELLDAMVFLYNGIAQGSLTYFANVGMDTLRRASRLAAKSPYHTDPTATTHPTTYTDAPLEWAEEDERYERFYDEDVYDWEDGANPVR